jgi:uncharacterized protein (TIGR02757 family)
LGSSSFDARRAAALLRDALPSRGTVPAPPSPRRRALPLAPARFDALRTALDEVRASCDVGARRASDPVEFAHRYTDPHDVELVALLASSMAFGNVKALRAKIAEALERLGPAPARALDDAAFTERRLAGFAHRVYTGGDVAALLVGARRVQHREGSLGASLERDLARGASFVGSLDELVTRIRSEGGLDRRGTHGSRHILTSPASGSAAKRLMLYLRWMARPADGIDLGLWRIPTSVLVMPLDVHIHKLALNLGLTKRATPSFAAALDVTHALARFDPLDPVKYDFALCHLGMLQRCPSRRDPVACEGCGVRPVCRHWSGRPGRGAMK